MVELTAATRGTPKVKPRDAKKRNVGRLLKKFSTLYVILGIIMAYYIIFNYIPIVMGVLISFKNLKVGMGISAAPWVGLDNFLYIFKNPEIVNVVKNTLAISVLRLLWGFWPPILLAIFIFDLTNAFYKRVCQTIVYVPYFFSWVIVYGIVFAVFSGNGFVNGLIFMFGGERYDFMTDPSLFRSMIIGSQLWKGIGWGTILYFAALTNVNPELYEAARVDGAGPLTRMRVITLPSIMPIITFSLIMALGSILNNDFEQILLFYNAAVYSVGDIIDTWVYRIGLGKMQYSIGSAVGLLKAIVSLVLIVAANYTARRLSGRGMW